VVIEQRYASGAYDRVPELAADLVRLNMDVIAVDGPPAAKAVKAATASIPIVFTLVADPVAEGLATSMSRPGANLTGLTSSVGFQLAGKRVELLKDRQDAHRLRCLQARPVAILAAIGLTGPSRARQQAHRRCSGSSPSATACVGKASSPVSALRRGSRPAAATPRRGC